MQFKKITELTATQVRSFFARSFFGLLSRKNKSEKFSEKLTDIIRRADLKALIKLRKKKYDFTLLASLYGTTLHSVYRISNGNSEVLRFFLDLYASDDFNERDRSGNTLLDTVVIEGRLDLCRLLVTHGVALYACDDSDFTTPIQKAIRYDQEQILLYFLKYLSNHERMHAVITCILKEAVIEERMELIDLLVKYDLDLAHLFENNCNLLSFVKTPRVLRKLCVKGFDINHQDEFGVSLIAKLVMDNSSQLASALLEFDPNLNDGISEYSDLLLAAAKHNNIKLLAKLITKEPKGISAEIKAQNIYAHNIKKDKPNLNSDTIAAAQDPVDRGAGQTEHNFREWIICSCISDRYSLEVIKFFIAQGANINGQNHRLETPLMIAAQKNNVYYLRFLNKLKVNPDIVDVNGKNALMHAIINQSEKCVMPLMSVSGNFSLKDKKGLDIALHCAIAGTELIAKFLMAKGINIDKTCSNGQSTLILAAMANNGVMINYLHQLNADLNAVDCYKRSALMYASGNGQIEAVKLLLSFCADKSLLDENGDSAFDLAKTIEIKLLLDESEAVKQKNKKSMQETSPLSVHP